MFLLLDDLKVSYLLTNYKYIFDYICIISQKGIRLSPYINFTMGSALTGLLSNE